MIPNRRHPRPADEISRDEQEEFRRSEDEYPNARRVGPYWDTPPFDTVRKLREQFLQRLRRAFQTGALQPFTLYEAIGQIRNGFFGAQYVRWYRSRNAASVIAEILEDLKQLNRQAIRVVAMDEDYLPKEKMIGTFFRPTPYALDILDELKRRRFR
ncbi:MAG: hypothetical protein Q8P82_02275 [bacterium]|nr:hypothetical protein [bacterium]